MFIHFILTYLSHECYHAIFRMISKKRKDFEYKIRKHVRCKEDFLKYVSYECILLQNIRLRREQYAIKDKKSDIEYAISKRVVQLYRDLTTRFFDDIEIWLNFIEFCKNVQFTSVVTSSLDKLTQVISKFFSYKFFGLNSKPI